MKKYYEDTIPDGYVLVKTIDAKDKKTVIRMNILSFIPVIIGFPLFFLFIPLSNVKDAIDEDPLRLSIASCVFFVTMFLYIVLHELTHGAAYKLLTKKKLTFGMTLSVAFCGVPEIYVYRRASLIATLAPFVTFIPVFTVLMLCLQNPIDKLYALLMLTIHIGGCIGDLWCTYTYLFKLRDPLTLTNDTGPKQTFYIPK